MWERGKSPRYKGSCAMGYIERFTVPGVIPSRKEKDCGRMEWKTGFVWKG